MHRGVESEYMWGSYGTSVSAFKKTTYQMRECQSHIVTRFGEILRLGNEVLFSVPTLSRHIFELRYFGICLLLGKFSQL